MAACARPTGQAPSRRHIARRSSEDRHGHAVRHGSSAKSLVAPSVVAAVPLDDRAAGHDASTSRCCATICSIPGKESFAGFVNYRTSSRIRPSSRALQIRSKLVFAVLVITVVGGTLFALLLDQPILRAGIVRLMVIAPFFIMPTVSALVWKNMLMHPVSGLFAWIARLVGLQPIDWFAQVPLLAVILIVAWQWLPFATLILLTALQSLDEEQKEAAEMDGAPPLPSSSTSCCRIWPGRSPSSS